MSTMRRSRRAARRDERYKGQKHEASTWQRRLAAKVDREFRIRMNKGRKKG